MQKPQMLSFVFSIEETNVIFSGLAKLPAEVSRILMNKIEASAQQQIQAQQEKTDQEKVDEATQKLRGEV